MDFLNLILTSLLSICAIFIITKLMGHKQIAQLDFFDYISGITIGSIAAELATELESPWKPLVAILIYGIVSVLLSQITNLFPKTRKFINGTPTILMDGGKLYRKNFKKARLDLSEFMVMCREQGYFDLSQIQTAVFEYNGHMSILPVSTERPMTPADMNLSPKEDHIFTEVIMDGHVLDENLKRMGLNATWLEKQLKAKGYKRPAEIYLGVCDHEHTLTVYPVE